MNEAVALDDTDASDAPLMGIDPSRRRVAMIGGSGGIGAPLTLALCADDLFIFRLSSRHLDVTDPSQCNNWFAAYHCPVVIFAAVRNHDRLAHRTNAEQVAEQVAVTCAGLSNVLRACLPYMRERSFGRVIFLSSVVARTPVAGAGIYGACKAFGEALIRTAAIENASHGVTCNSIRMGYFDAGLKDRMSPEHQAAALAMIPARRWGSVAELARVIRCIVETEYLNGATIDLTGGL